jgi:uncharacterized membrane protein YjgN (DUF898 family)
VPFRFTGSGAEYFRIWIVNLLLTIVTLGIYSAWAKVRRNRYFYGHTRLGDASFEYTAAPLAILEGRLIAVTALVIYSLTTHFVPATQGLFGLLFVLVLPWLVVRTLRFRARNSRYRNIAFDFGADYGKGFVAYVLMPMLATVTLGLLFPLVRHRQARFTVRHSAYGTSAFDFGTQAGAFYRAFYGAGVLVIAGVLIAAFLPPFLGERMVWFAWAIVPPVALFAVVHINAHVTNAVYNGTRLEGHAFRSELNTGEMFLLYLTNIVGIVLTLGLFIPWARVRLARYRAERLTLLADGDLSDFIAVQRERVGSAGEELGEMLDIDIGL